MFGKWSNMAQANVQKKLLHVPSRAKLVQRAYRLRYEHFFQRKSEDSLGISIMDSAWLFHEKCNVHVGKKNLSLLLINIISKFCDLHKKETKHVRIYMTKIINCCFDGECFVPYDHVMVRGFKRYAVYNKK